MPSFSRRSIEALSTCDYRLIDVARRVIASYDFSVLVGHRSKDEQEEAFRTGNSTKHWPDSKHNSKPSLAFDLAPYPIDWKDEKRFHFLAGLIVQAGRDMGIRIRWGGDWDSDGDTTDQQLADLGHFEVT
jgi:hypothetical protein